MKIFIRGISLIYLALLLLLGSSMAKAEQEDKDAEPKLLYKYSEVETVIKISLINKKNTFLFSIKDQGVGIPKKYLPRITERFFRVDPARSKEAGGTGLGLAIVKHIVNQHKARMEIFSEEGKGTEFIIEFPKS